VGTEAVKPRAHRPKLSEARATVKIGSDTFEVAGRTAQLVALLVLYEKRVNEPASGKLVAHFRDMEAQLELRERLPYAWLRPD
jgi:hypothetical protein